MAGPADVLGRLARTPRQDLANLARAASWLASQAPERGGDALWRYMDGVYNQGMALLSLGFLIGLPVFWVLDPLVLGADPELRGVFNLWRASIMAVAAVQLSSHRALASFEHRQLRRAISFVNVALIGGLTGYFMGKLGGVGHSWIHGFHGSAAILPIVVVGPRLRAAYVATVSATFFGAFFGFYPQHLAHPEVGAALLTIATSHALCFAAGHALYTLIASNWLQRQAIEARAMTIARTSAMSQHLLSVALPAEVTAYLGAGEAGRRPEYADVAALRFELLGLRPSEPRHRAALQEIGGIVARLAEDLDLRQAELMGIGSVVVDGLDATDRRPTVDRLQRFVAALTRALAGREEGDGLELAFEVDVGQVLVGRARGETRLYDPWETLLQGMAGWRRRADGVVVAVSPRAGGLAPAGSMGRASGGGLDEGAPPAGPGAT